MRNKQTYTIKQNLLFPLGVILFVGIIILGFFILTHNLDKTPRSIKLIFIGIPSLILTSHLLKRIFFYWELILYDDIVVLKKPFGVLKNNRKEFKYNEIEEAAFFQGFRTNTSLRVDFKSGKKYNILLDKNLTEITKILIFLENSDVKVGLYCDNRIKKKLKKDGLKTA